MKKLSKAQQEVIDLMRDGWQLGLYGGMHSDCRLQKGGCGKGGPTRPIRRATAVALLAADLIKLDRHDCNGRYYSAKQPKEQS
jgi:hypothetical protein